MLKNSGGRGKLAPHFVSNCATDYQVVILNCATVLKPFIAKRHPVGTVLSHAIGSKSITYKEDRATSYWLTPVSSGSGTHFDCQW